MRDMNSINSNHVYRAYERQIKLNEIDPVNSYKKWLTFCPPPITNFDEIEKIFVKIKEEELLYGNDNDKKIVKKDFITRNLGLVLMVVDEFLNRGISYEDLIQAGNIGLIKAVNTYDPNRGFMFSTYAVKCIRNELRNEVTKNSSVVSIAASMKRKIAEVFMTKAELMHELKRYPTDFELADKLGMDISEIHECYNLANGALSFDEPLPVPNDNGSGEGTLYDFVADEKVDVYKENFSIEMQEKFNYVLDEVLNDRDRYIIKTVFKFDGYPDETYEEIGKKFNITRQRVQQIVEEIKTKLRRCNEVRNFEIYLDGDSKELDRQLIANRYSNTRKKTKTKK